MLQIRRKAIQHPRQPFQHALEPLFQYRVLLDDVSTQSYRGLKFQVKKWRRLREYKKQENLKERQFSLNYIYSSMPGNWVERESSIC